MIKRFALFASLLIMSMWLQGQTKNPTFVQYIEKYKPLAIDQQRKHKVPAAITIAQGLLESKFK